MPVVGTPGFQDGVQIPAVSLLDSYHKALAFSWVGCKGQEMAAGQHCGSLPSLQQGLWTWVLRFQGRSSVLYPVCCLHALTVQQVHRFLHPETFP